jgi:hypothetical protein
MKLRVLSSIGMMLLLAACANPPAPNYQAPAPAYYPPPTPTFSASDASLLLKRLMTEEDVIRTLGSQPNSVEMKTCGAALKAEPYPCKTMEYKDSPYRIGSKLLMVVLQENPRNGVWMVIAWHVI